MIESYIKNNWGIQMFLIYNSIDKSYGPARADLFRYLILYDKGGIYIDIKSSCNQSFDNFIHNNDEYILTNWGDYWGFKPWAKELNFKEGEFINWFIASKPNHIFLKNVIYNIIKKILYINNNNIELYGKKDVLFLTGPVIYSQTILYILKNKQVKNIKIYKNYKNINLIYTCVNHINYFKNHYSKNNKLIINKNKYLKKINIENISIFYNLKNKFYY